MTPTVMTNAEAAAKILATHAAGRLMAQMTTIPKIAYYHRTLEGIVYNCAIGCLFPQSAAKELDRMCGTAYMLANDIIDKGYLNGVTAASARTIQRLHDSWAAASDPSYVKDREEREQVFLEAVRQLANT